MPIGIDSKTGMPYGPSVSYAGGAGGPYWGGSERSSTITLPGFGLSRPKSRLKAPTIVPTGFETRRAIPPIPFMADPSPGARIVTGKH